MKKEGQRRSEYRRFDHRRGEENDRDGGGSGYLQHEFTDVVQRAVKWQLMKARERET